MRMYDLIAKKRDGGALTPEEIRWMIRGYTEGTVPDEQMSAFCMAVFFRGMTVEETAALTMAMAESGDTVDLSRFGSLSVDKHSTGGVGDKVSLIVAPLTAAGGLKLAKMSGRGLGHTGGTVDKLESFPGYRTAMTGEEFLEQTERIGVCVTGQSGDLAPADKKLYALRDVTATVNSIPLIASSIMSKKIAAGAKNIVLDVKVGSGAFMKTEEDALALARTMVDLGRACGRNVTAILTDMDRPLGFAVGNICEVKEAMAVLDGADVPDLREVCLTLAGRLFTMAEGLSVAAGREKAERLLDSGAAKAKFREWIGAQGGDVSLVDHPETFPVSAFSREVKAPADGWVVRMDAEEIGRAAVLLGAGRAVKTDAVDWKAGIVLCRKTGDPVKAGDTVAVLSAETEERLNAGCEAFAGALRYGKERPEEEKLILAVVD